MNPLKIVALAVAASFLAPRAWSNAMPMSAAMLAAAAYIAEQQKQAANGMSQEQIHALETVNAATAPQPAQQLPGGQTIVDTAYGRELCPPAGYAGPCEPLTAERQKRLEAEVKRADEVAAAKLAVAKQKELAKKQAEEERDAKFFGRGDNKSVASNAKTTPTPGADAAQGTTGSDMVAPTNTEALDLFAKGTNNALPNQNQPSDVTTRNAGGGARDSEANSSDGRVPPSIDVPAIVGQQFDISAAIAQTGSSGAGGLGGRSGGGRSGGGLTASSLQNVTFVQENDCYGTKIEACEGAAKTNLLLRAELPKLNNNLGRNADDVDTTRGTGTRAFGD